MKTVAYLRVSTDKQETDNQRFEINNFCVRNNLVVDEYISETVSGGKNARERQLWSIIERLDKGDSLIVRDISRIGRSILSIMDVLQKCLDNEIRIYVIDMNLILEDNLHSKIMASTFGVAAEIQRHLIRKNIKEALTRKKKEAEEKGERFNIGRPIGYEPGLKLDGREDEIKELLSDGVSKTDIAKILNVRRPTLYKFIKKRIINYQIA